MTLPRDLEGVYLLDSLPRVLGDRIRITVRLRDQVTGQVWDHQSDYGNVEQALCLVRPVGEPNCWENHWVFQDYWWADGNFGCDCNRSGLERGMPDCDCNEDEPNRLVINRITPQGMADVVLYAERLGTCAGDDNRRLTEDEIAGMQETTIPL